MPAALSSVACCWSWLRCEEGAGRLLGVWPLLFLPLGLACQLDFLIALMRCFSRVRARVAASRMGLPPHVLYHGLFIHF